MADEVHNTSNDSPVVGSTQVFEWAGGSAWLVPSEDEKRSYGITRLGDRWTCQCASWFFRQGKDCKHIRYIKTVAD